MQEEESKNNIDLQKEVKDIVLKELENKGVIDHIKSEIKSNVLFILENQKESVKQTTDFDFMTPLYRKAKDQDEILACHLIRDFLKVYQLEYTFPIFEKESNVKENIERKTLVKEFGLNEKKEEEKKPLLIQIIQEYKKAKKEIENMNSGYSTGNFGMGFRNRTDEEVMKIKSNGYELGSINVIPNRKNLAPIGFGNNNKSVEMGSISNNTSDNADKFNNFPISISNVYDKPTDVLNKNKTEPKKDNVDQIAGINANQEEVNKGIIGGEGEVDDGEFQEREIEDIKETTSGKVDENEESKKSLEGSTSNMNSVGFDSSVKGTNLIDFDHVENAEAP